jgi:hypothetical protein
MLAVGLALALAPWAITPAEASAQTVFQATVSAHNPKPQPCAVFACGNASIAGYGPATWTWNLTNLTDVSSTCASYQAISTFELSDGSTLTVNETGLVCGPGNSAASEPPTSFGHPSYATGSWTVAGATGQFQGLTGTGTDVLQAAGAELSGAYTATLDS